jgi:hypothetical protein
MSTARPTDILLTCQPVAASPTLQFADEKYGKVSATFEAPAVLLAPVQL